MSINPMVLAFALGTSLIVGLLFGLAPAVYMSRADQVHAAGTGTMFGCAGVSPRGRTPLTQLLVVWQLVLATTLLVGAGLLIRSFIKLASVESGFDPTNVLTFQLVLPQEYGGARRLALANDLAARLRLLPQVATAGFTNSPPLRAVRLYFGSFIPPGFTPQEMAQDAMRPEARLVSEDYLRSIGARLHDGRWFDERDANPPTAVLVNQTLVRRYYGGRSPVGTFLRAGTGPGSASLEIIGVVDDIRQRTLEEPSRPMVFRNFAEGRAMLDRLASAPPRGGPPPAVWENSVLGTLSFAVRGKGDPILADVRAVARQLDRAAALDGVATLDHLVSESIARPRFYAVLLGIFAAVAGLIAAVGVYGVLAYSVT